MLVNFIQINLKPLLNEVACISIVSECITHDNEKK